MAAPKALLSTKRRIGLLRPLLYIFLSIQGWFKSFQYSDRENESVFQDWATAPYACCFFFIFVREYVSIKCNAQLARSLLLDFIDAFMIIEKMMKHQKNVGTHLVGQAFPKATALDVLSARPVSASGPSALLCLWLASSSVWTICPAFSNSTTTNSSSWRSRMPPSPFSWKAKRDPNAFWLRFVYDLTERSSLQRRGGGFPVFKPP